MIIPLGIKEEYALLGEETHNTHLVTKSVGGGGQNLKGVVRTFGSPPHLDLCMQQSVEGTTLF